jgi:hypothetical protein
LFAKAQVDIKATPPATKTPEMGAANNTNHAAAGVTIPDTSRKLE